MSAKKTGAKKGAAWRAVGKAVKKAGAIKEPIWKALRKRQIAAFVKSGKRELPPLLRRHFVLWAGKYIENLVSNDAFGQSRQHLFRLTKDLGNGAPENIMPVSIVREAIGHYLQQECGIPYSSKGDSLHTRAKGKLRAEFIAFVGRDKNRPERKMRKLADEFDRAVLKLSAHYIEWEKSPAS